jgi:hypothetical protein
MQMGTSSLAGLARMRRGVKSRRWSSFDRTGGNRDNWPIPAGHTVILGETSGPGCVRHIWMTTSEPDSNLKRLVLRAWWDGEETPSIQCPVGDYFGLGHGKATYFESLPVQTSYLGMNSWFPMPFATGARFEVTNDSDADSFLYFYVDYEQWDESGDEPGEDLGRFHANWRRELLTTADAPVGPNASAQEQRINTTGDDNYLVLEAEGSGHYVGCFLHLDTNETGWWGEGDDMFFVDGESWPPHLHGTGMEDYFCGAWNYNRLERPHCTPYYGYHFQGNADYTGKHSQYRFHVEDPVVFSESLRFSIEHGHANDRQGDWVSTAFWYQTGRTQPLPDVGSYDDRVPYSHGGLERWPGKDRGELPT